jgi:ubiquinone/menaquinone biosynthesis C-methylase UbiE
MSRDKRTHLEYQRQFFDSNCDFFRQPIPAEVEERTRLIVNSAGLQPDSKVLDVGTGMGVLVKHFLECGVEENAITGCDLSEKMLEEARKRFPDVAFVQGDFVDLDMPAASFDAVFFNACFGNIIDQDRALAVCADLLRAGGKIVISQPLGNNFMRQLQQQYPELVVTLMPSETQLKAWCEKFHLDLVLVRDEPDFYLSVLAQKEKPID